MIYGIGITDLPTRENGKHTKVYNTWVAMFSRIYGGNDPSYKDCTVCEEWHLLSNFKKWFDENYIEGYVLDKDILVHGNKTYSPETCCFVPHEINEKIKPTWRKNSKFPNGIYQKNTSFIARFRDNPRHLGVYPSIEEAFNAYKTAKEQYVKELAEEYFKEGKISNEVYNALLKYEVDNDNLL